MPKASEAITLEKTDQRFDKTTKHPHYYWRRVQWGWAAETLLIEWTVDGHTPFSTDIELAFYDAVGDIRYKEALNGNTNGTMTDADFSLPANTLYCSWGISVMFTHLDGNETFLTEYTRPLIYPPVDPVRCTRTIS